MNDFMMISFVLEDEQICQKSHTLRIGGNSCDYDQQDYTTAWFRLRYCECFA